MHSDELEDIPEAGAGDIVAMFGVECSSGDTFTDGSVRYAMTSIKVPDPVMSLALVPTSTQVSCYHPYSYVSTQTNNHDFANSLLLELQT